MGRREAFGRIFVRQVDAGLGLGISFTTLPVIVGASNPWVPALLSGLSCRNSSEPLAPVVISTLNDDRQCWRERRRRGDEVTHGHLASPFPFFALLQKAYPRAP